MHTLKAHLLAPKGKKSRKKVKIRPRNRRKGGNIYSLASLGEPHPL